MITLNHDFVTNSSSTCFVLCMEKNAKFSSDSLMKAVGVNHDSCLEKFYIDLFDQIEENKRRIKNVLDIKAGRGADQLSRKSIREIKRRFNAGEAVYMGDIENYTLSGSYYLGKRVIIIGDDFYFNWEPNAY